jgi:tetratricopeptide (TPR) repeat protein
MSPVLRPPRLASILASALWLATTVGPRASADQADAPPPSAEARYTEAQEHFKRGRYAPARALYLSVSMAEATDPKGRQLARKATYLVGLCEEALEDYPEALRRYRALAEADPKSPEGQNAAARVRLLAPQEADGFRRLRARLESQALIAKGEVAAAIAVLEGLELPRDERAARGDRDLYFLLGEAYRELQRYRQAAECYAVADRHGIPDAAEYRARSLRYITRAWIAFGARWLWALLALALLARRPWRCADRALLVSLGATFGSGALLSVALLGLGRALGVADDAFKPIDTTAVLSFMGCLTGAACAAVIYAKSLEARPSARFEAGAFALLLSASTLALLLDARDWLLMLGL